MPSLLFLLYYNIMQKMHSYPCTSLFDFKYFFLNHYYTYLYLFYNILYNVSNSNYLWFSLDLKMDSSSWCRFFVGNYF